MDPRVVFSKTEKGEAEITSRTYKLNHALRYVLILVDGKSSVGDILAKGAGLPRIEAALDQLAAGGFIHTLTQASQPVSIVKRDLKAELIALAYDMLGNQSSAVVKKLNESDDSPDALSQAVNTCKRLIKLAIDEKKADEFQRRAQEIIYASTLQPMR